MANTFVMGARLEMRDMFSGSMRDVTNATNAFRSTTLQADRATGGFRDQQGRLRNQLGLTTNETDRNTRANQRNAQSAESLSSKLLSLKNMFLAVAGASVVKKGFNWLIGANADLETYRNTLSVVMGSQEKAVEQLKWAEKFAGSTPFEIPQIMEATVMLESYGIQSQKTLGIVGDMASVMGKDLLQAVQAVANAQTGELASLKSFGISKDMIEEQARLMGVQVTNNQGQITDQKAFNAALFQLMEKRFKGGMEMQAKSFKGIISMYKDFWGRIGRTLGAPLFDNLKGRMDGFLQYLYKLEENGSVEKFIGQVMGVFRWLGHGASYSYGILKINFDKIKATLTEFYTNNKPKIDGIKNALVTGFLMASNAAEKYLIPVLSWTSTNLLPMLITGLSTVAGWVLTVANFFIDNWSWIGPIVTGIAIAWGTYHAALLLVKGATIVMTAVQKGLTIAQWALNAAMTANPIGLIITAIGLLIGAGILLWKNWDKIKEKALELWGNFSGMVMGAINSVFDFFGGIKDKLFDAGASVISTITDGIKSMAMAPVNAVKGIFGKVREFLPFSDAKRGPFSDLTGSGGAILTTLAKGVYSEAGALQRAVSNAFSDTPISALGSSNVNPAGSGNRGGGGNTTTIAKLFDTLIVQGTEGMDEETLADKVIDKIHEKLTAADDVEGADMGGLLYG